MDLGGAVMRGDHHRKAVFRLLDTLTNVTIPVGSLCAHTEEENNFICFSLNLIYDKQKFKL